MIVAGHGLAAPRVVERCRATLHSISLLTLAASALLSIGCREAVAPIDRIASPAADHLLTHVDVDDLLSRFPPGAEADIRGLNNLGQATGAWSLGSGNQKSPYRWTPGGGFTTIAPLSANTAWGNDINDAGVVAGVGTLDSVYGARAAVSVGSAMVSLGLLPGLQRFPNSEAVAINSAGEVVEFSSTVSGTTHAVLWDASRVIRDLGTLGGGHSGSIDINDFGQVIGWSEYDGKNQHPFLWTAGTGMRDLAPELGGTAILVAINGHGQIAGNHTLPNGEVHAFLFTPGAGIRDLGTLGGRSSSASGLNDQGFVVGASMTASSGQHAFLWTPDDGMEDITALAGVTVVRKVNDRLETITGDFYIGPPRIVRLSVMTRTS